MKRSIVLLTIFFILSVGIEAQSYDWAISTSGKQVNTGAAVCVDVMGNSYITGSFMSTPFGIGGQVLKNSTIPASNNATGSGKGSPSLISNTAAPAFDMFVAMLDRTGTVKWAIQSEGVGEEKAIDITCDPKGHAIVLGTFTGTSAKFGSHEITHENANNKSIFLLKVNALGNINWVKKEGRQSPNDRATAISSGPEGEFYITGTFTTQAEFSGTVHKSKNGNNPSAFVAKYLSNGHLKWLHQIYGTSSGGQTSHQRSEAVFATNDSRFVYVAGWFRGHVTFGEGKTITSSNFQDPKVFGGEQDLFITKYDSDGKHVWTSTVEVTKVNQSAAARLTDIVVDHEGSAFITGDFPGLLTFGGKVLRTVKSQNSTSYNYDIFLAKIDQMGNHLWQRTAGDARDDRSNSLALTPKGVVITGNLSGKVSFGKFPLLGKGLTSMFTAEYDTNGTALRAAGTNGSTLAGTNFGNGIAANGTNTVVIGTFTGNQIGFPGFRLNETGQMNIFVAKVK